MPVPVPDRSARLERAQRSSEIVDRAIGSTPGGERRAAEARGVSKAVVHRYRDVEESPCMTIGDLLVKDGVSRRVLQEIEAVHGAVVMYAQPCALVNSNPLQAVQRKAKEHNDLQQAWMHALSTDNGHITDAQLDVIIEEAQQDLEVRTSMLLALHDERARRAEKKRRAG